jgi:hypothetical protein
MNGTEKITEDALNQFTGSVNYVRHWSKRLVMTEGAVFLTEHGAAWLLDAIASYQPQLRHIGFQLWKLEVADDHSAVLTCREDQGTPVMVAQRMEFTDFPLPEVRLYVIDSGDVGFVAMLPTEY